MYLIEYDFFPDWSKTDIDAFWNGPLSAYLGGLYRRGVLMNKRWQLLEKEDRIRLIDIMPTDDALDPKYHNRWIKADREKVLQQSRRPPEYRLLGEALDMPVCCDCESPGWYVLVTTFIAHGPPVECGDCGRCVPLYRLPLPEGEEEHADIRSWEGTYQACDTLFMGSGVGEQFGYRQMSRPDSPLTQEGRAICRSLAALMGKPWYYYLTRYYSPQKKTCPGCGEPWKLEERLHGLYDYKCDRCCLLSTEPM